MTGRLEALLEEQVCARSAATAVIAGQERRTFAELHARSRVIAAALAARGVAHGDRVVMCGSASLDLPAAILGVLMAGACCVPVDPAFPQRRVRQILDAAAARCIVHQSSPDLALDELGLPCVSLDEELPAASAVARPPAMRDDEAAFVFFTSGSTGVPKGVVLSHRTLLSRQLAEQERIPLSPEDRMLFRTTVSFDVLIRELFWPLIAGCPLVVAPEGATRDPHGLASAIAHHDVSVVALSPTLLRLLLRVPEIAACSGLRHVLSGGETLTKELQDTFYALLPWARLHNFYGPTEAFTATYWSCPPDWPEDFVPIGHPTDLTVELMDAAGVPVPRGEVGEIWLSGVGVADGYLNAPEETAKRFSVTAGGERRYKSGDLAYERVDGALVFAGRLGDQVKLHGQRIELSEVERAFARLPRVADVAVAVRTDAGPTPVLVAYIVAGPRGFESAAVLAEVAAGLPAYMVPSLIVELDELPVGVTGKLDRTRLPAPPGERRRSTDDGGSAAGWEACVLECVRAVTGVADVQLDDDLLRLPIDSLRLVELTLDLEQLSGEGIELADVLAARCVRELCESLAPPSRLGAG